MKAPLVRTVRVACSIEQAFNVFTGKIDLWWPPGHRRFKESTMILEAREGGKFLERSSDGQEALLGEVLYSSPPDQITYTWYPGAFTDPTRVDIHFSDMGDHTLVEVTHSEGSSNLGELWLERVEIFGRSWNQVLEAFAQTINRL